MSPIRADVFINLFESYHMVLGVEWLATLDDIMWNSSNLSMMTAM